MSMDYPRLLVISHNLFDRTNNVGKTLQSLLKVWPKDELYSLYFRNEKPSEAYCNEYFLLHDKDVLKAVVSLGTYKSGDYYSSTELTRTVCNDAERNLYRIGNQRRPIVSRARDILWHTGFWRNKKLKEWIKKINPEIILFVPNDYELAFDVLDYVAANANAGIITYYMDDAFYYKQKISGIDKHRRKRLLDRGKKVADISGCLFTTCDLMSTEYRDLFSKECFSFGNCIKAKEYQKKEHLVPMISYIGNLHSNRWKSILEIGSAICKINTDNNCNFVLLIYSASDISEEVRKAINNNRGLKFCGALSPDQVLEKQEESDILVHVESMDEKSKASTRLSVSTKIFEYLSVGKSIFAYGPNDIASMHYLNTTGAAVMCYSKNELKENLEAILFDSNLRDSLGRKGEKFAKEHCDADIESPRFAHLLLEYGLNSKR